MLNKVVDYKMVSADRPGLLETRVKEALADGWVPSGNVFEFKAHVHQVMVRFETES